MPELALCTYALPTGRVCRQPRLREQQHCRFHVRNNAVAEHDARMFRLNEELMAMDLPGLLETLRDKLENILCFMRSYPEAKLTLMVSIDRLNELTAAESMTVRQAQPNQSAGLNPQDLNALMESLMKTMNCDE
jgi:hypothetical protein